MTDAGGYIPTLTPWLTFKGFEACVVVKDVGPVTVFGAEYKEATDEASVWIPSKANKSFAVDYRKILQDEYDYSMSLFLDGKKVACAVVRKSSGTRLHRISFIPVSATETKDFVFNSAALTDDDTYLDMPSSAGAGEIKIVLQPVNVTTETKPPENTYSEPLGAEKIHERSKRGLVHQIGFDNKTTRPSEIPRKWLLYDLIGKPVVLIFKYRSLDMLQASGIVPINIQASSLEKKDIKPYELETSESERQSSRVHLNPTAEKVKKRNLSPKVKREDSDMKEKHEEAENEDSEIVMMLTSIRGLLTDVEKAVKRKRSRTKVDGPSVKVEKECKTTPTAGFTANEVVARPKKTQDNPAPPKKKAKRNNTIPAGIEIIDLT